MNELLHGAELLSRR